MLFMRRQQLGVYELADGRTVWLNNASGCVARFGVSAQEVGKFRVAHPAEGPTMAEWRQFTTAVRERLSVEVPQLYIPEFLIPN